MLSRAKNAIVAYSKLTGHRLANNFYPTTTGTSALTSNRTLQLKLHYFDLLYNFGLLVT